MTNKKRENVQIGLRVKQAREAAGLTQERLAELVDVTAQFLSSVERGTVGLSVPVLNRLCSILLVPSDFILARDTEPSDVTSISARLSRLPPEHIGNVEEILNRYIEGIAIEQHSKKNGYKSALHPCRGNADFLLCYFLAVREGQGGIIESTSFSQPYFTPYSS